MLKQREVADPVVWERDREETAGFGVIFPAEALDLPLSRFAAGLLTRGDASAATTTRIPLHRPC